MGRMTTRAWLGLSVALSMGSLAACTPSPEKVCASYSEVRKKDDFPTDSDVEKECTKQLSSQKEKTPKAYACAAACIQAAKDVLEADKCPLNCELTYTDPKTAKELWQMGIAPEASGAWASSKSNKISSENCREGARAIASKKLMFEVIQESDVEEQRKGLETSCKHQKGDEAAAALFKCMRKAEDKNAFFRCSLGGGGGGNSQVDIIEGCVAKCQKLHPGGATPDYMSCFDACKAAGGP